MCTELTILTPGAFVAGRTQTLVEGNTASPISTLGATVVGRLEVPRHCNNESWTVITGRPDPITSVEGHKHQNEYVKLEN